jgi:hypothetical protein
MLGVRAQPVKVGCTTTAGAGWTGCSGGAAV